MELFGKKVLVIGMAKSGISAALFCKEQGANVTIYDGKSEKELGSTIDDLSAKRINTICGVKKIPYLESYELMVLSPGVPTDLDFIIEARGLGMEVIGEVELAYAFCQSKLLGITGTNGKTTTTSLVGDIIKRYHGDNLIVGNIGIPFTSEVNKTKEGNLVVAELSSFQLESIKDLHCQVSAILNITPDHINRHKTFENYVEAKGNIFMNSQPEDVVVLNMEDKICREYAKQTKAKVVYFTLHHQLREGIYLHNNEIILAKDDIETSVCTVDELKILGDFNIENVMAAIGITAYAGVPLNIIRKGIISFEGVAHRNEYVDTIKGVRYYNDSKATNEDAAIKGLSSMKWPVVLIGGGMDKGSDFKEWVGHFEGRVKNLIVFGETKDKIKSVVEETKACPVYEVDVLLDAVNLASRLAKDGECVLLSPACASWDMFKNFEERGNLFKEYVAQLKE